MSVVYGVHVIRSENVASIDVVFTHRDIAEGHAREVSDDAGVLASAVTEFVLDEVGRHTATALFVAGRRQELPDVSGGRYVWADVVRRRARAAGGLCVGLTGAVVAARRVRGTRCGCSESEIAAGHRRRCRAGPPACLGGGGLVGVSGVYGVHVVRRDEVEPVDVLLTSLQTAQRRAQMLSRDRDAGVLGGAVTRFVLNELGQRSPTALFVAGTRQRVPHLSDDRDLWANAVMPRYSRESPGSW